ncbi:MAG: beta-galactosidase, partial [Planctomycetota bacterium]
MRLGTQYYRAPFPEERFWDDDLKRMKDSGLNTVQLWVLWGWVEATPGTFVFDDYDRLVELAGKHGLGVVLSTIAEIQPYWIHREIPGSEMLTRRRIPVQSGNRIECHYGITPGGCTDHPVVWERMAAFLAATAERYVSAPALSGWDAWNELRWNVSAGDMVCYCDHTLTAYRQWLDARYGGLDGLNRAWKRRYSAWDEVWPGIESRRPYTDMMAWSHFLTERANQHARNRYDVLKGIDPDRPVTVHGGGPSPQYAGSGDITPLDRGNDWHFADHLDGVGCSSFPKWFGIDDADFGMRIEFVKSAARDKAVWLSELQGGRASQGFEVHLPVDALSQQRWIWNGIACGADTVLFWCWRDEVFGTESAGYGLIGRDGLAEERMDAMRVTGAAIEEHQALLDAYRPAPAEVGVLFSPQAYYYHFAQEGVGHKAAGALNAYCRALVRRSIPYQVVEEEHLEALDGLRTLFLPRTTVLSESTEAALEAWVRGGGTLVCESECGAFNPEGLYRYPDERWLARLTGVEEIGRRTLPSETMTFQLDGQDVEVGSMQWITPLTTAAGEPLAPYEEGSLLQRVPVGTGQVVLCAGYPGEAYHHGAQAGFETYVEWAARLGGWTPEVRILAPAPTADRFLYVKHGKSGGRRLVFVFFQ